MLIKYNHKDVSYLEYTMFETKLTDDIMIMMYYHTCIITWKLKSVQFQWYIHVYMTNTIHTVNAPI